MEVNFDLHLNLINLGPVWQKLLYAWKFQNQRNISYIFMHFLKQQLTKLRKLSIDRIIYIDSGKSVYQTRRFQPCKDISNYLSKNLAIPYGGDIYKVKNFKQSRLNIEERYMTVYQSMQDKKFSTKQST